MYKNKERNREVKSSTIKPKHCLATWNKGGNSLNRGKNQMLTQHRRGREHVTAEYLLCVDEHMLLEVLPPHKQLVTVVTLEILLTRVDDHVGLEVGLLGARLVTQSTPVILLTCPLTHSTLRIK